MITRPPQNTLKEPPYIPERSLIIPNADKENIPLNKQLSLQEISITKITSISSSNARNGPVAEVQTNKSMSRK